MTTRRPPARSPAASWLSPRIVAGGAGLALLSLCACGPAQPRSAEDVKWSCSGEPQCMELCQRAEQEKSLAEKCQALQQQALAARKAGFSVGPGNLEIVGRSSTALPPSHIAARAIRSIAVIETKMGLGTGFVVGQGRLATNLHVVAGADAFKISMSDNRHPEVTSVVAYDPDHDLAILALDASPPILVLAPPDSAALGEPVVAIGNPLGLAATVSNGLVSGLRGPDDTPSVLQISAPIAPGSSGGPVFNEYGEVIGVATAVARAGGNVNFAVPSKFLLPLMKGEKPTSLGEFAQATKQYMPSDEGAASDPDASYACTAADRKMVRTTLKEALDAAEPLCAAGKNAPCAQLIEGALGDIASSLSPGCQRPRKLIARTKESAAAETTPKGRATFLRGAARTLLDMVED